MKASQKVLTFLLASLAGIAASAIAATPAFKVGDPAPKLLSGRFIQGDPVTNFEAGKTYIVEFWATWCPPCRETIPHLNDIQAKYKDKGLIIIGQDCLEHAEADVAPFIKQMGDKMTYRVALDEMSPSGKGKIYETWMDGSGRIGIPTAFIVNSNGVVAWIGYAMELVQKQDVIEQIVSGKYDLNKAAADYVESLKADEEYEAIKQTLDMKMGAVAQAMHAEKWDQAITNLAEAEKAVPEKLIKAGKVNFDVPRWRIFLGQKDYAASDALAAKIAETRGNDAGLMNFMARQMVDDKANAKPNLDLAQKLADQANTVVAGKIPAVLDTQARIMFLKGQKDAAVTTESKALALSDEQEEKALLQKNLDSFKSGKLPGTN